MKYSVSGTRVGAIQAGCVLAGVYEGGELAGHARDLDARVDGVLGRVTGDGDHRGKLGETLTVTSNGATPRVVLVGLGKARELTAARFRKALLAGAKAAMSTAATDLVSLLALDPPAGLDQPAAVRHSVECFAQAAYRFTGFKSKDPEDGAPRAEHCTIAVDEGGEEAAAAALATGEAVAAGVALARDLGNAPPNVCTPSYLAETAQGIAGRSDAMTCTVLEQAEMEELGMGSLLSVTRGSRQPPKLVVLEYRGGKADEAPVALVGKGITFDTGGICIKPAANLDEMKYDMCGAAGVLGTMESVARLAPAMNVVAVVPCVENMPDGQASRPGDIVTAMDGQTIEILNTDAEGRLILCDAITYARRFSPAAVVDVATLTGACVIALGEHFTGLMSNHDGLAEALSAAGERACDAAWRLPITEDYAEQLKSNFADFANIGGRPAGAITAGCFLAKFAKDLQWAHLDIAGTAWKSGSQKGGTGRPVPLLTQFLLDRLD
jgi:leucyl aminopeptidase